MPTEKHFTIGYGHYGPDVKEGDVITKEGAEQLLFSDIKVFEECVTAILDACEISVNQNQFDALVCYSFNVGLTALQDSILLNKREAVDVLGAANEFLRWNKSGGKELSGLTRRREAERRLFLAEVV